MPSSARSGNEPYMLTLHFKVDTTVNSFKNEARIILDEFDNKGKFICIGDGQKTAVLIGLDQYRAFRARLEDLEDALELKENMLHQRR